MASWGKGNVRSSQVSRFVSTSFFRGLAPFSMQLLRPGFRLHLLVCVDSGSIM